MQREGVYEGAVHPAHRGAVQVTDTSARSRRALLGAPLADPPDLRGSQGPGARGGPRGCTARAGPAGGRRRQPGQRCAGPRLRQGAAPGRAGLCRAVPSCAKPCRAVQSRAEPCRAVPSRAEPGQTVQSRAWRSGPPQAPSRPLLLLLPPQARPRGSPGPICALGCGASGRHPGELPASNGKQPRAPPNLSLFNWKHEKGLR